ncbi:MAG TPA: DUF2207 domain-containing protein, partial [Euzebya sp.]|nr:DUF2207 domain-containing protein [Euzebya sp.]
MTSLDPPHHPRVARRLALWAVIVLGAGATGLFWAGQRQDRTVDATVQLSLVGQLDSAGTLHVTEELVVQTIGQDSVQRILVVPAGVRWAGVTDDVGQSLAHTTLELPEGVQVTVPLRDEPSVLRLNYDLIGIAHAGMDAAELVWPVVDDRNPLAISGLEVDVTWPAGAGPEVVDVEAPGAATTVVPRDGGLRVQAGALPAHHAVEVHAAIPREAVTEGMVEQRSVLAGMTAPPAREVQAGGGPAWPPVVVSLVFLAVWGAVHRSHGREPDGGVPSGVEAPPSAQSPAEVAWLLRRGAVRDQDLVTTIVDLTERGIVAVDGGTWMLAAGADALTELPPHEQVLLAWLFDRQEVLQVDDRLEEIRHAPSGWRDVRREFTSAVEGIGRSSGLVERTVDAESVLGGGVAATSMVVLGVVGTALGQPTWLLCVAVGALAIVAVDTFARRSR